MSKIKKTPNGWMEVKLQDAFTDPKSEIVDGPFGSNLKSSEYSEKGIPLARLQNINRGEFITKNMKYVSSEKADELLRHNFSTGDILITKLGAPLGEACIAPATIQRGVLVADVVRARVSHPWLDKKYLTYQINSDSVIEQFKKLTKGTTRPRVNLTKIRDLNILVAPFKEQVRIVEKLDELFSELDAGVKELKAAQTKLSQYRQSLLKSAVEGSLTQQWRDENTAQVQETGEQLLARILKQRREQWQQQKLAEFTEKGKTPPKNWQDAYPEPVQPDATDLPQLPEGWVWASMGQVCQIQGGIQKQPKRRPIENKYPFLRVANVYRNELRLDEVHEIELFGDERQRLVLLKGDILIVEGNGSKSEIGRCAIWNDEIKNAVHQNHLIRSRPVLALSKYVALWLNSPAGMNIMSTLAATTSGLYTLSVSKISKIPVPIPSVSEQSYIADKIDAEFDAIDRQIEATALSLKQSEAQRKNILKSAFSGQLVPQNPNDEPASVLLEKIKREREALAKKPKTKQIKTKSAMKKITVEELAKWVGNYKGNSFTFEELQTAFQGDYDQLKDCVFDMLSVKKPLFKQVFDHKLNAITFIKEDQ